MAIERMKTPSSRAWLCMRTRSPRMAPPEKGDDGIDGQHATCAGPVEPLLPADGDQLIGQGRLASAGRTGDPDRVGVPRGLEGQPGHRSGLLAAALDQRQQAGQRHPVAAPGRLEQR